MPLHYFSAMTFPDNLRYSAEHEWVRIEGDYATIGISDFAASELGDIVFVDINTIGQQLEANAIFGSVEAVKTVSDLFMPVSGTVEEFNKDLEANPELVNSDAYGKGWMVRVKLTNAAEVAALMDAATYQTTF